MINKLKIMYGHLYMKSYSAFVLLIAVFMSVFTSKAVESEQKIAYKTMDGWQVISAKEWPQVIIPSAHQAKTTLESKNMTVSTNITYLDVVDGNGLGFDDPIDGVQRQATFNDAVAYVISNFINTGSLDIEVSQSQTDGTGALAFGGALFFVQTGFQSSFAFQHISSGVDPFAGIPDITITIDFGHDWNIGSGVPAANESDFFTIIVHEITHGLGFTTLLNENGVSSGGGFTTFDQLLQQSPNTNLFDSTGNFILTTNDLDNNDIVFNGSNAQTSLGVKPPVRSPSPFEIGSSLSHWDKTATDALGVSAVMTEVISRGTTNRTFAAFEIQTLRDLGYAISGVANTAPVISSVSTQTVNEGQSSGAINFTVSDAESSSSNLTISATSSNQALVKNSAITLGGSGNNRTITLMPIANANGNTQITINASDGLLTSAKSFTLTVNPINDAPIISGSPSNSVASGESYNFLPDISDPDDDNLSVSIANKPNWMIINSQTGLLSGIPDTSDIGVYTNIILTVGDGNLTSSLSPFNITVTGNTPPTAVADIYNTNEGASLIVNSSLGVLANDSDIDNDNLTVALIDMPAHALSFNLASDGSFSYQHDGSESINDQFSYRNTDGELFSETVIVQINITAINDQPLFNSTPVTSAVAGQNYSYQLLAMDADSTLLEFTIVTAPAYLIIDNQNRLSGIVPSDQRDNIEIIIQVSDGNLTSEQTFIIEVQNKTPIIDSLFASFSPTKVIIGDNVNLNISFAPIEGASNIINVTLTGLLSTSSDDCTANNNVFECIANAADETNNFTLNIVPDEIGDINANISSSNRSISADISVISNIVEQSSNNTTIFGVNSLNFSTQVLGDIQEGIVVSRLHNGQHQLLIYDPLTLNLVYSENINAGSPLIITDINADGLADLVGQVEDDIQIRITNNETFSFVQSIKNSTLLQVTESDNKVFMLVKTSSQFIIYQFSNGMFDLIYQENIIFEDAKLVGLSHGATNAIDLLLTRVDEQLDKITEIHFDFIATLAEAKNSRQLNGPANIEFINGTESKLSFIDIDNDQLMEIIVVNAEQQFNKILLQISSQSDELTLIQTFGNAKVTSTHVGDFNADGSDDLLIHNTNGVIQVFILDTITQNFVLNSNGFFADTGTVIVADFDQNGVDDVAIYDINNSNLNQYLQQASSFTEADLAITTNDSGSFGVNVVKSLTFTLTNIDNDTSHNIILDIVLPELLTFNSLKGISNNDGCIITELQIVCNELAGSTTLSFTLDLTANTTGMGSLMLSVSSDTLDTDLTNNQIQLNISANNTPAPPPSTSNGSNSSSGSFSWLITLSLLLLIFRSNLLNNWQY